jgi:ribosomal protein S18 acetylase RimI-like enzyme
MTLTFNGKMGTMFSATAQSPSYLTHIRKLDLSRDLDYVADLIELCFPINLDPDGQTYIRQMREAARNLHYLRWLNTLADTGTTRLLGFVWEEGSQLVGNLSLIPFQQAGLQIHLIANVAVHPDYRRRGIGRALTQQAITYLRQRNEPRVWLQVRQDNPAAQALYRNLGFSDQFTRTTWRIRPSELRTSPTPSQPEIALRKRSKTDWNLQKLHLDKAYHNGIRWYLPVDFSRFEPGWVQTVTNFLDGTKLRHWTVLAQGRPAGTITWQKTDVFAHNIWLALEEESEPTLLPTTLRLMLNKLSSSHPLSVDYPHDRHHDIFESLGFQHFRTLIWMSRPL